MNDIYLAALMTEWERLEQAFVNASMMRVPRQDCVPYDPIKEYTEWLIDNGPRIRERLRALESEVAGFKKTDELWRKGMESQAELMDGLKQENRQLRTARDAALEEVRQYAEILWRAYDDPEGPETPAQLACENIIHFVKNKLKETHL